jgi:hypothetical protein
MTSFRATRRKSASRGNASGRSARRRQCLLDPAPIAIEVLSWVVPIVGEFLPTAAKDDDRTAPVVALPAAGAVPPLVVVTDVTAPVSRLMVPVEFDPLIATRFKLLAAGPATSGPAGPWPSLPLISWLGGSEFFGALSIIGVGVTGVGVTGVTGSGVTVSGGGVTVSGGGNTVTGVGVTRAGVTGVTGIGVTAAGVTGVDVTGVDVTAVDVAGGSGTIAAGPSTDDIPWVEPEAPVAGFGSPIAAVVAT